MMKFETEDGSVILIELTSDSVVSVEFRVKDGKFTKKSHLYMGQRELLELAYKIIEEL